MNRAPFLLFEYVSTRCKTEVVHKAKAEAYSNLLPMDEQPFWRIARGLQMHDGISL